MEKMTDDEFMKLVASREDMSMLNASKFYVYSGGGYSDPNKESRMRDISKRYGVSMEIARNYYDKFRQEEAAQTLRTSPALSNYLADADNKIPSRDSLNQVSMPERIWNLAQAIPRALIAGGIEGSWGTLANMANVAVQSMPTYVFMQSMAENPQALTAEEFDKQLRIAQEAGKQNADALRLAELSEKVQYAADYAAGDTSKFGVVDRGIVSGVRSIGAMAPAMMMAMATGNPMIALAQGGAMEGFGAASEDLREGRDLGTALSHGWINGLTEVATELVPVSRLIKDVAKGEKYGKMVLKNWIRETPGELAATTIQNFTDIAAQHTQGDVGQFADDLLTGGENHSAMLNEYKKQYLSSLLETGISVLPMALMSAGMARAAQRRSAMTIHNVLAVINKEAQASELNNIDTEAYRILNQTVIERTDDYGNPINPDIKNVRIDYDAWVEYFTQNKINPEKAADDFGIINFAQAREQALAIKRQTEQFNVKNLEDAVKGGAKLVMPLDMYASHFAKAGHGVALLNDTTLGTELTPNELARADYLQRVSLNNRLKDYVQTLENDLELNDALNDSIDYAHQMVRNDLKQLKGKSDSEYEAQAKVNARMRTISLFRNRIERAKEMGHELSNNALKRFVRRDINRYQEGIDDIDNALDDIRLNQEGEADTLFTKTIGETAAELGIDITEDDERILYENNQREEVRKQRTLSDQIKAAIQDKGLDINTMSNDEIRQALGGDYERRNNSRTVSEKAKTHGDKQLDTETLNQSAEITSVQSRLDEANRVLEADAEKFAKEVDRIYKNEKAPSHDIKMLSKTPVILELVASDSQSVKAANEGGVYIDAHAFSQVLSTIEEKGHPFIADEVMKQLPKALANPIAIFDPSKNTRDYEDNIANGDLVFMIGVTDATGSTVVVPISLVGKGDNGATINIIKTVYGQSRIKQRKNRLSIKARDAWFYDQVYNEKTARYINERLWNDWLVSSSVAPADNIDGSPIWPTTNVHGHKVYTEADFVNKKREYAGQGVVRYQSKTRVRGYTRINPDATMNITLLKDADFSTYSHETAHYMLESMKNMIAEGEASQAMIDDYNHIMAFVGNKGEALTRAQHEQFAQAFEKYLMEGQAPTPVLKNPFQRFKKWLTDIYRHMVLDVDLTQDVRDVFNRMLAADEEIERMKEMDDIRLMLDDADQLGLTNEEKNAYTKLLNTELESAKDKLRKRLMRDKLKERTQAYKDALKQAREDAKQEYETHPIVEAIRGFSEQIRLNKKNLIDTYGEAILKQLPKSHGKNIYVDNGEVTVYDLSQEQKISQEELIDTLKALKNRSDWIENRAQEMVKERHQEMMTPHELEETVELALNNDDKEARLKAELSILRRANRFGLAQQKKQQQKDAQKQQAKAKQQERSKKRRAALDIEKAINAQAMAFKATAIEMIAAKNSKELRPQDYLNAMRSTSRKIKEALFKANPDYRKAAFLKEQELMAYYLYREAQKAQDQIRQGLKQLKTIRRMAMAKALKNRTAEYVYKAKYIAGVLLNSPDKKLLDRIRLEEAYNGENAWDYHSAPITALSVNEALSALGDVKEYWKQARDEMTIETEGKRVDINEASNELIDRLSGHRSLRTKGRKPGFKNRIKQAIRHFIADTYVDMARMESWCDMIDGGQVGKATGPWTKYIFNPINLAADLARAQQEKVIAELSSIYEEFKFTEGTINADELGFVFGETTGYGKAELIHACLHMGNASNLERLINGHKWGDFPVVPGTTNTTKWEIQLKQFADSGVLTQADMDRVQRIWDLFESLKPQSQKAYKAAFGRYFDEIPAKPFTMFGKEYKGGYVPVIYDPTDSVTGTQQAHTAEDLFNGVRDAMPKLKAGWGESRVDTTGKRLLFDLSKLRNHLQKQVLFAYMGPAAIRVEKLLNRQSVREALNTYDPEWMDQVIKPWLNRAVMQNVNMGEMRTATDKVFNAIRSRSGCAIMFGNWINAVEGFFDLTAAFSVVDGKHVRQAFGKMMSDRKQTIDFVMASSVYMKNRLQSGANNANNRLEQALNPSTFRKMDRWVMDHAYFMQEAVDGFTAPLVWTAAYNQASVSGLEHEEAVQQADKTVRSVFGSTNPEDIAKWEGGSAFRRMFTQFTGYFVNRLNLNISEVNKIVADENKGIAQKAASITMLFMKTIMLPAWIGALIRKAIGGSDKDESWAAWLADVLGWSTVEYALGMGGYVGQGANALVGTLRDPFKSSGRVFYPPALKLFGDIGMNTYKVYSAWQKGDNVADKVVGFGANMNNLVPILPVIPNRLTAGVGYLAKVKSGKVKPTSTVDFVRGIATGRASPDSKR